MKRKPKKQSDDLRDLIRDAEFEKSMGDPCKLKLVLYTIYNRGRCFATLDTLAEDCSMSRSTLKRYLKALEEAEIVSSQHERATLNAESKKVNSRRAIRSISAEKLTTFRMSSRVHLDEPMNSESDDSSRVQKESSRVQIEQFTGSPGWTSKPNPINQNNKSKDSWLRISGILVRLGVKSNGCLEAAKRAGCSPEFISELIVHWKKNRDACKWGCGALHDRIERAKPEDEIWSGWPTSSAKTSAEPAHESHCAPDIKCPKCSDYHPKSKQSLGLFQCGSCNQVSYLKEFDPNANDQTDRPTTNAAG